MRLVDRRFAGIARGVGTAKIIGRVHSAQIKLGDDLYLACSCEFISRSHIVSCLRRCHSYDYGSTSVDELFSLFPAELGSKGKGVDLLFGLDMLKRHQAILDLQRNELVIQGRHVRFLSEHELPDAARDDDAEVDECVALARSCLSKLISLETEMATSKYLALAVLLTRIKLSVQRQRPMLKPKRRLFRKVGVRRRAILPPPRLQCSRQAAALGILKQRYRA